MPAKFPRPHLKTRTGCYQCKRREVKCDECKPACANCIRTQAVCSYLQYIPLATRKRDTNHQVPFIAGPACTPPIQHSPPLAYPQPAPAGGPHPLPLHFNTLDLELFHFYLTQTSNSILGYNLTGSYSWNTSVVSLSFQNLFLLHELLSFAALHLAYLHDSNPTLRHRYNTAAVSYCGKSISQFRIAVQNITRKNSDACNACAALLGFHPWLIRDENKESRANLFFSPNNNNGKENGVDFAWYKLNRGAENILKSTFHWVKEGPLWESIKPWESINPSDPTPLEADEEEKLNSVPHSWVDCGLPQRDVTALEETLQTLRRIFSMVSLMNVGISHYTAILSWSVVIPQRFCEMIEERVPQALVLVAVYCVLLKRLQHIWWVKGKEEDLLDTVRRELMDEHWHKWLEWPVEVVESVDYGSETEVDRRVNGSRLG